MLASYIKNTYITNLSLLDTQHQYPTRLQITLTRNITAVEMLVITLPFSQLLLLLLLASPLASASPFTLLPHPRPQMASKVATANNNNHTIPLVTPASTAPTSSTATPPQPAASMVGPQPQPLQLAVIDLTATTTRTPTKAATTPTPATLEELALAAQTTDAPPANDPDIEADLAREGYSQVTYYSCERYAATTMCGWHVPVVKAVNNAAATARRQTAGRARAAAVWALMMGVLLGRRW